MSTTLNVSVAPPAVFTSSVSPSPRLTPGTPVLRSHHPQLSSRESLRRTLAALVDAGLVMRNPGHGHPLRADYVLTEAGKRVAPICAELVDSLDASGLEQLARKKWLLPVVLALSAGPARFSGL